MKGNPSSSYQNRLIGIYMLCLLLALIPLIIFTQLWLKPKNLEQNNRQTLDLVESNANEIGSWLDQRISEIRVIHSFIKVSGMNLEVIKPYITNVNEIVRDAYGNPQETYAIGGTDGLGWINDSLTIDVSNREYFQEAMRTQQEYVIGAPVVSKSDHEPIFLICYPIRDEAQKTVGFINGSINLDHLSTITDGIQVYDGTAWIMNQNTDVYTSQSVIHELYGPYLSTIAQAAEKGNGSVEIKVKGQSITVFYAAVPYAENWLLCDAILTSSLTASTDRIVNSLLACAIIASLLICLASFFLSRKLAEENQRLIEEVSIIDERERKAEIRALQAQINPHFLYNILDTIQWKALDYHALDIAEMIQKLSQIFRISLSDGKEAIPVAQEIKHVQSYLDIQKTRYKEKIDYTIQVDPRAETIIIPKLIIQPLVENSIYHGIKEIDGTGHIAIEVSLCEDRLQIEVHDDGKSMSDEMLKQLKEELASHVESDHYGLFNIYEKLYLTYGKAFSMTLSNQNGFHVILSFPDRIGDEKNASARHRR